MTNKDGEIGVPGLKRTISSHGYLTAPTPTTTGGRGFLARETLTAARLVHRWAPSLTDETLAYAAKWQGAVGDSKWGQQVGKIDRIVLADANPWSAVADHTDPLGR